MQGTENDDTYVQPLAQASQWITYNAHGGNDTIRLYNGSVAPGAGLDWVEKLASTEWWQRVEVMYGDSPAGVTVDLAAGWADDGWGTRDTLIGVSAVHGNWHDDRLFGSAEDNIFYPNGGRDLIDGRGGMDTVFLPWINGAPATIDKFNIVVSIDGRSATITMPSDPGFRLDLTDVERIAPQWEQWFILADYIDPKAMGEQGLTGNNGQRWNAAGALGTAVNVSYSFVESAPASGPRDRSRSVQNIARTASAARGYTYCHASAASMVQRG